jgi:UDP-N-acetylglucosamine--N-acetylmuramyl-(pentapeptide) pyrophosphoryl-undecaprenol N-acetylglucosamine transferase
MGESGATYILAGGGTGGHICPGIAVAESLTRIEPDSHIVFACSRREIDGVLLGPLAYGMVAQPVVPLPRGPLGWGRFLRAWRASRRLARDMIADLKPKAVLGLGGFAAGPVVREAARANLPTGLLNPDAVPGKANRYLSRGVDVVFTQFAESLACFPASVQPRVRRVGCPVRMGPDLSRAQAATDLKLDPTRKTLLILGGSLGAANINRAMQQLRDELDARADRWQILHLSGRGQEPLRCGAMSVISLEFCTRMDLALGAADLVVCRGGASSLAELAATSTPAVIVPYPYHRDLHQLHNAKAMASWGAAVVCEDMKDAAATAARLRKSLLSIMDDPSRLDRMALDARRHAETGAAETVVRWLARGEMPDGRHLRPGASAPARAR